MTLREFEMHRPRLAASLVTFIRSTWSELPEERLEVTPLYDEGIRFVATVNGEELVCFGPGHPLFSEADDGPGCTGTWWWSYDIPGLPPDHKFQKSS